MFYSKIIESFEIQIYLLENSLSQQENKLQKTELTEKVSE